MSHQVRLDDDVYEHIKSQKRDDETFSEAIERLTGAWTLLGFAERDAVVVAAGLQYNGPAVTGNGDFTAVAGRSVAPVC